MERPYKTLGNVVTFPWLDDAVNKYVAVTGCDIGDVVVESVSRSVPLSLGRESSSLTVSLGIGNIVAKGLFYSPLGAMAAPVCFNRFLGEAIGGFSALDSNIQISQFGGLHNLGFNDPIPLSDSVVYRTPLGAILCDDASRDTFVFFEGRIRLRAFGSNTDIWLPSANYNVDSDGWLCIDNEPVRVSYSVEYFDDITDARIQVNSSGVLRVESGGRFRVLQGYDVLENARYAVKFQPYTAENSERCTSWGYPVPTDQTLWEGVFLTIPFESFKAWLCYYDIYSLKNIPVE